MSRRAGGFTLIEVLLATVLLAAGLALALTTLRAATVTVERGEALRVGGLDREQRHAGQAEQHAQQRMPRLARREHRAHAGGVEAGMKVAEKGVGHRRVWARDTIGAVPGPQYRPRLDRSCNVFVKPP